MTFYNGKIPLASIATHRRRMLTAGKVGAVLIVASLAIGMAGYAFFEHLGFLDSFVNASMILSGMGPVGELHTRAGKVFAGLYALYSGFALLTIAAVLLAPVIHRFLHRFHIEMGSDR